MPTLPAPRPALPLPPRPPALSAPRLLLMSALATLGSALPHHVLAQAADAGGAQVMPASAARDFSIPAGDLSGALAAYSRQSGVNLAFDPAAIAGQRSNGVQGSYSVDAGLAAVLSGTGLRAVRQGAGFTLQPASNAGGAARAAGASATVLDTVMVTGQADTAGTLPGVYAGGQIARGGRVGILGNMDVLDTPFSMTNITSKTIEDQQARSLADVAVNDPSVRAVNAHGSFYDDFSIRGFNVRGSEIAFGGLFGLAASRRVALELAERVEILRGPTALLTGMSPGGAIGGGINIVPKRAGDTPLTRITGSYISDSQFGGHVDVGRRFGEQNEFGIRVNGLYRNGKPEVEQQGNELGLGSIALDYAGQKLQASLDAYVQKEELDRPRTIMQFASTAVIPKPPSNRVNYLPGGYSHQDDAMVLAKASYELTDGLSTFGAIGTRRSRFDNISGNPSGINSAGDYQANIGRFKTYTDTVSYEAGFRGRADTGPVRHDIILSGTILEQETGAVPLVRGSTIPGNIYQSAEPTLPEQYAGKPPRNGESKLTSWALVDNLSFLDDRVRVIAGLRYQQVESRNYNILNGAQTSDYDKAALTPMAGLVFRARDNLSFYGNYIQGLSQGSVAPTQAANAGQIFAPFKSEQIEAGVKWDGQGIGSGLSLFQITRPAGLLDPDTLFFSADGEQRNRGVEVTLHGEPARGVRLLGGASYTQGKLTRAAGGQNVGKTAQGVPRWQWNMSGEVDVGAVPGLTLLARATYTDSQYVTANNAQEIPSWIRYDVGARFQTRIAGKPVTLRATIENLANKSYWIGYGNGWLSVSMPRTYLLSASVAF